MLSQVLYFGFRVGEVSCPARYFAEASSINFTRSCAYGLGCLWTALQFRLARWGLARPAIFQADGKKLTPATDDRDNNRTLSESRSDVQLLTH